jgi:hypothetical protein
MIRRASESSQRDRRAAALRAGQTARSGSDLHDYRVLTDDAMMFMMFADNRLRVRQHCVLISAQ